MCIRDSGHEDHIGALPYVLRDLSVPVYGTRLTMGLVRHKLKEAKVTADLHEVNVGDVLHLNPFKVEFLRVNHSIAEDVYKRQVFTLPGLPTGGKGIRL